MSGLAGSKFPVSTLSQMASCETLVPPSAVSEWAKKDVQQQPATFRPTKAVYQDRSCHREWNFLRGEGPSSSEVRDCA